MHKKEIFVTKKGYIFSDWKKLPKKCSKDHKLPKKCSKTKVAQKLLERPKVAEKLPSNLCKSLQIVRSRSLTHRINHKLYFYNYFIL